MSTEVAPPPYFSTSSPGLIDLKKLADDHVKLISTLDQATFQRELNAALDSERMKELIDNQIRSLAENTLKTRAAFEKIGILLGSFDSLGFRDAENNIIGALRPGWELLRKTYNDMLEESHKSAIKVKAVCDEYIQKVLGALNEEDMSMDDVKSILQDFIEGTNYETGAAKTAAEYATSFDTLRTDVNSYQEKIKQAFGQATADPEGKIPMLTEKIKDLRTQITEQQAYINRCITAVIAATGTGATSVLFSFVPFVGIATAGALLAARSANIASIVKAKEMEKSKEDLKAAENELADLQAREQTLKDLRKQLVESEGSFDTIVSQLAGIANFWTAIKADCMGAAIHLEDAMKAKRTYGFKKDLGPKLGGSAYIALSQALAIYVSQITELTQG